MTIKQAAIIGLGLIGGSIAKALKEKLQIEKIIGIDNNTGTLENAMSDNVISAGYIDITPEIADSDLVFLCTPVSYTVDWLKKVISVVKPDCIITDVRSTKSQLIDSIQKINAPFHFIGGHPMAGSEKSGYGASKGHLFENAYYILTPCSKSDDKDIKTLTEVVESFGSIPIELTPEQHDLVTATISHVPHIISAALVNLVKYSETPEQYLQKLAAGGFKDITRISSSNPEMWHNICISNKSSILKILSEYISLLNNFSLSLKVSSDKDIYEFFNSAKVFRDTFTSKITGLIPGTFELVIDVVDKPGIIGEVATLLGREGINIKNINVNNSREFEGGVLIVSLPDKESYKNAYDILSANGYKVVERG